MSRVAVAIVGGGPSGLTAAAALAPEVAGEVLVLEREAETGGIPRHSDHPGYGLRDLRRFISGPAYARRLTAMAADAGANLETEAMVTGWAGDRTLQITSPRGVRTVTADAVILATGARERPRPARLIPGDRPDGVYTTGQLQNLVHLHHGRVGSRAVIVGAELVSWSAVLTLRDAGCATVAMVSGYPRAEAYAAFRVAGRALLEGPVLTSARVVAVHGRGQVQSVTVERDGRRHDIACDTVVFTGDWIPDHELARTAGVQIDPATRGPAVDAALRTSRPGVFAVGNLLHPVDTADGAALDGRHVATAVRQWLRTHDTAEPVCAAARIRVDPPLRWAAPQLVSTDGGVAARGDLLLWTDEYRRLPVLRAVQDGRALGTTRTLWPAAPGRVYRAPWSLVADADPKGGDVTVSLA
ncbi:NAD(P)/FAD-dependent oxidoreductase [Mycolicibacterium rufum]|uniref:FAD-dependent oxidoreductase n=1 Tax=Mycolicibacterium rufum TaxID=318424 RepID=A0A9X2YB66_9MYCO|nr:FAD-dependent oxidoreductase [Mycolicibacterium rufum]KGI68994.1 pyridine nucleotide-disulfide oxidoreductase [Mycolicibacterium rufum]MCV7070234.1 FAD-dependent oxidoreductase [Mycolicibacterium rufum]ULP35161.1 NAD(P)/FAD-dependent oxidoreductase [Mycolicibacterium rufum]